MILFWIIKKTLWKSIKIIKNNIYKYVIINMGCDFYEIKK